MKEQYFDKLKIRNRVEVNIGDYYAYYYEDYFFGEWVGNVNICKDIKQILHITTNTPITEKELKQMLENYLKEKEQAEKK